MVDLTELFKDMYRMKQITKESVERARDKDTKRICFATTHAAEPKRSTRAGYVGSFNIPFGGGFSQLFSYELFQNTHDSYHEDSFWRSIGSDEEFDEIDTWVKQQGDHIFLRACLYTSIAMSHNFTDAHQGSRTELGDLEDRAQQHHDVATVEALAEHCINKITDIPLYRDADLVCATSPRPDKDFDLPS